jgi:hypothetical protein
LAQTNSLFIRKPFKLPIRFLFLFFAFHIPLSLPIHCSSTSDF